MNIHEQVLENMKQMVEEFAAKGIALTLPALSSQTMGTYFIDMDLGKMLAARIQYDAKFANPMGMFQGGFISAAIDEVYGPLTFMAAGRPVVTLEMSTTYIRPFCAKDEYIDIKAEVISKTRSLIIVKAEVKSKAGKLIAISSNHAMVTSDQNLLR